MKHEGTRDGRPRIAVIGAGAMGVSLAGVLAKGASVTLVVRDRVLAESIRRRGVAVRGLFEANAAPHVVPSIGALGEAGPFEAVFVATKTTVIDQVAEALAPVLPRVSEGGQPCTVVSFQNGIEPGRELRDRMSWPQVVRMVINYGARLEAPGIARITQHAPPHAIGGPDALLLDASNRLALLFSRCGLPCEAAPDIEPRVWAKGILNASMNSVAALTDSTVGEVLDSPARLIVARLLDEGLAVARAEGHDPGPDALLKIWAVLDAARSHTPSMVEDIRLGRPTEVGQLNRQVIEHARRTGVPVPSHELVAALIEAFDWRVFHRTGHEPPQRTSRE
ncbi:MAG: 2-dehydropantoate 2-reductase [Phycisphaerales bacterium]|nr:2-dehydropantoate 2-reductase [Phycisphaerales bacterium]